MHPRSGQAHGVSVERRTKTGSLWLKVICTVYNKIYCLTWLIPTCLRSLGILPVIIVSKYLSFITWSNDISSSVVECNWWIQKHLNFIYGLPSKARAEIGRKRKRENLNQNSQPLELNNSKKVFNELIMSHRFS